MNHYAFCMIIHLNINQVQLESFENGRKKIASEIIAVIYPMKEL